jgi:hypothetical protein
VRASSCRPPARRRCTTARDTGWTTIVNGKLLALAAQEFDVFVAVDRDLSFQQNPGAYAIAVVVLRARTNRLADLRTLVPKLLEAIIGAVAGVTTIVDVR